MDGIYEWVRNITFYLIFMTVAVNLLPDKKYEKYIRLFAGLVLILLVLKPLTGGLHLEERLAYYFESISFQKEADELSEQILGMEDARLADVVSRYEEAVAEDIKSMAAGAGLTAARVAVHIDGREEEESFGKVTGISMVIALGRGSAAGQGSGTDTGSSEGIRPIEEVNAVQIAMDGPDGGASPGERGAPEDPTDDVPSGYSGSSSADLSDDPPADSAVSPPGERALKQEEYAEVNALRRRIADYYDLEEENIEIQLENG